MRRTHFQSTTVSSGSLGRRLNVSSGRPIGTSARVGGAHGVDVEAMEGFAILRACELAGVPAVELRVVSNEIDEPDRTRWRFNEAFATLAEALPRAVAGASAG